MADFFAHDTAVVDEGATIGSGTKIWHFAHIFSGAVIGENCSLGQNTMVSDGVKLGRNVKVQNNVAIYTGTIIEDDVFLGPSCVLTNVSNPRSQVVRRGIYETTLLKQGATIGANATIVCGTRLGKYCFIAAGAVVTKDVKDYALMAGVPARQLGWMSRHGHRLEFNEKGWAVCIESGLNYELFVDNSDESVRCADLADEAILPDDLAVGNKNYGEFKTER